VLDTYRRLARGGYVVPASERRPDVLDIADFFTTARLRLSSSAVAKARSQTAASVARLQKQGYDVRIARRPAILGKLPEDRKPRVVVVEDEPHLGKFVRQYLAFEGFDASVAANRDEIVAEFRRPPVPDLVLLDVMLPDVDGFDVLLKMRQHPALKAVPVIMLTAKATREAVLKGLAGGADGYVTKPVESETLIKAVKAVLGLPKDPPVGKRANAPWSGRAR
jgi:CheY-like chemotaxis protein